MSYRNWRGEEYTVKKVNVFPKLFLARESLLCDIPAWDGKSLIPLTTVHGISNIEVHDNARHNRTYTGRGAI
jgi:hypothetical protein